MADLGLGYCSSELQLYRTALDRSSIAVVSANAIDRLLRLCGVSLDQCDGFQHRYLSVHDHSSNADTV